MTFALEVPEWLEHAQCNSSEEDLSPLFFSNDVNDIVKAKRICAECPVIGPCLQSALERQEPWGVWGGQLFFDGSILTIKRRRGRPSKKAPHGDVAFPDVPVPEYLRERVEQVTIPAGRPAERKAA